MNELSLTPRFTPEITNLHKLDKDITITWHLLLVACGIAIGLLIGTWLAYYYAHEENVTIINLQGAEIDKLTRENNQLNTQLHKNPSTLKFKPLTHNI